MPCCREKVIRNRSSCVYSFTTTQNISVALHMSVSHSWCSRVRKGREGNIDNQTLTTLLSQTLSERVSLSF